MLYGFCLHLLQPACWWFVATGCGVLQRHHVWFCEAPWPDQHPCLLLARGHACGCVGKAWPALWLPVQIETVQATSDCRAYCNALKRWVSGPAYTGIPCCTVGQRCVVVGQLYHGTEFVCFLSFGVVCHSRYALADCAKSVASAWQCCGACIYHLHPCKWVLVSGCSRCFAHVAVFWHLAACLSRMLV